MLASVLVIEDEPEFADYLWRGLTYEGYRVRLASTAEAGLDQVRQIQPDLVILDIMLPGMDGLAACRRLRAAGFLGPILMLTARDAIGDRVNGLNSGADDYLVKPFAFEELLARLRALLRRAGPANVTAFGDLELNPGLRSVHRQGHVIALTRTEYDLLALS
jgi:two-component system response regulator MprA